MNENREWFIKTIDAILEHSPPKGNLGKQYHDEIVPTLEQGADTDRFGCLKVKNGLVALATTSVTAGSSRTT